MAKARYDYACSKCGGPVTKTPVGPKTVGAAKTWTGLHGWRCTNCGPVKVTRTLRRAKEKE